MDQIHCLVCDRIQLIKDGKNNFFVKELETGYVVLGDHQFFHGYTLFLSKYHVFELHELDPEVRVLFLKEMSMVAEAVYKTFQPKKLNYELLGNGDPHLHWHLFPRYENDPTRQPIWVIDKSIRMSDTTVPSEAELNEMKKRLLENL